MRTLGELVDKLCVTSMKLWFCQEEVFRCAKENLDLPAEVNRRLTALNLERNKLMTEIDECLNDAVSSGSAEVDPRIKIVD